MTMEAPYLYLEINIICILLLGYLLTKCLGALADKAAAALFFAV